MIYPDNITQTHYITYIDGDCLNIGVIAKYMTVNIMIINNFNKVRQINMVGGIYRNVLRAYYPWSPPFATLLYHVSAKW